MTPREKPPFQLGLWSLLVFGIGLFLFGAIPIAADLVVSNRVIDDGWQLGDDIILAEWDAWAFRPRFLVPAACGLLLIVGTGARLKLLSELASQNPSPAFPDTEAK
jgi:hypothetical protein